MTRASDITEDRVLKYSWPGMPELTLENIRVVERLGDSTNKITWKKFIVEAVDSSGAKWTASGPPRVPGIHVDLK